MTELFDRYGANYSAAVQSSIDFAGLPHGFFLNAKADLLRALIADCLAGPSRPRMLDVGCGIGSLHPYLRGMTDKLCGIDVSSVSLAQAQKHNPEVEYRGFDGRTIPYDAGSFDLVTAICVLHHVPPTQWFDFVREMRRVIRPGGLVCIVEHNPFNPLTRLAVARCEFDKDAVLLRASEARRLMTDSGLDNVRVHYFLLFPTTAAPARRLESSLRRLPLGAQYAVWGAA